MNFYDDTANRSFHSRRGKNTGVAPKNLNSFFVLLWRNWLVGYQHDPTDVDCVAQYFTVVSGGGLWLARDA